MKLIVVRKRNGVVAYALYSTVGIEGPNVPTWFSMQSAVSDLIAFGLLDDNRFLSIRGIDKMS